MTDQTINITISGPAGSGKSTLTYLLADFLDHTGCEVDAQLLDWSSADIVNLVNSFDTRLDSVKSRTKIVIREVQEGRTPV